MNKANFSSYRQMSFIPDAVNTYNDAGGVAYSLSDQEALSQLVLTGTFNQTFYASAENQLDAVKTLLNKIGTRGAEFVAKLAVYARRHGYMKDTPVFLTAWLSTYGDQYLEYVFNEVIDNGKMLRNFVQVMRSGAVDRKSLGTKPKKLVQKWIQSATDNQLLSASVGNSPSLADIIKMVHPAPSSLEQNAFFKWIIGGKITNEDWAYLPKAVKDLINFRQGESKEVPKVPFELLTSLKLSREDWIQIARNASWHMARMNINTFMRNDVFSDQKTLMQVADLLSNPEVIARARVMPYQIFTTWLNMSSETPLAITHSLEKALDLSLSNVPVWDQKTYVFLDVSGSMSSPITGTRKGSTSTMRCIDVASLIASSFLRVNSNNTKVIMFDTAIHKTNLDPKASVMQNARILAKFNGGGTNINMPLQHLVSQRVKADLIVYVSDNESWIGNRSYWNRQSMITSMAESWSKFKAINPSAKMVCIDLTPNTTTQMYSQKDVLNVGGFSDSVYEVISSFLKENNSPSYWTDFINDTIHLD